MNNNTIAIIPARSGSKGVPKKNTYLLGGYPLVAYAIVAAKLSKEISRVIVSTDSKEIAEISGYYGAETPFLRPAAISGDKSTDKEFVEHAMNWFEKSEGKIYDYFVHLRPTTPLRHPGVIDKAVIEIKGNKDSTSLRSIHELAESPHKVFQINNYGYLKGFFPDDPRPEYYNLPRQTFPKAYFPNGYVDIIKIDFVKKSGFLHGPNMLGFLTSRVAEVDGIEDFEYLQYQMERCKNPVYEYLLKNFPRKD